MRSRIFYEVSTKPGILLLKDTFLKLSMHFDLMTYCIVNNFCFYLAGTADHANIYVGLSLRLSFYRWLKANFLICR